MRFALGLGLALLSGTAWAGAALDDGKSPRTTDPTAAPDSLTTIEDKVQYGFDVRLRSVHIPQWMIELGTERAAGGVGSTGFGADFIRKRGNFEFLLGFEFEHLNPAEGVYINSGDKVPVDTADYILGPDKAHSQLGWFSLEFTFINNKPINKHLAFRYGGGAGLGILTGSLYRWDTQCSAGATNSNPVPGCVPVQEGGQGITLDDDNGAPETKPAKYGLPPVFPVLTALIGLQIRPVDKVVINLEAGIRTIPFFGMSAGYFF
jgi:hypothetical protein